MLSSELKIVNKSQNARIKKKVLKTIREMEK